MADITMPQLGETVTEGTITRWLKQVGDEIAEDDVLFEVSTDKVDSEVPSPASGFLSEILVQEGETVDVGTRLAVISADAPAAGGGRAASADGREGAVQAVVAGAAGAGEDSRTAAGGGAAVGSGTAAGGGAVAGGGAAARGVAAADVPTGAAGGGAASGRVAEADAATGPADEAGPGRTAEETAEDLAGEPPEPDEAPAGGTDPGGPAEVRPAAPTSPRAAGSGPAGGGGTRPADDRPPSGPGTAAGKVLSPVVRRLIAEHDLDPEQIPGTGAGGRITRADVLSIIDRQGATEPSAPPAGGDGAATAASADRAALPGGAGRVAAAAPADRATPSAPAPASTPAPVEHPAPVAGPPVTAGERDTVIPFTNIRRRTAEHMVRSKHTSAHTVVVMEVDYSAVDEARSRVQGRWKEQEGFSLTYLPFISRAVIDAVEDWPNVNSSVGDDQLIVHNYVNLGIAVDLNFEGLLVPVIHDADGKRLRAIAREISNLAGRARSKRLTMDDISGGTFTLTNAGPFGTFLTIPVINQPQVAIVATDGVRKRPVVVELPDGSDAIAIHPVGNLVLAFDHRAFDGAYASAFMGAVKKILETRDWSAEL